MNSARRAASRLFFPSQLMLLILLLLSCYDLPTNPDNATNSDVSLSLKSKAGIISEQQVSDTAGNAVEIIVALRYPQYIQKVIVQLLATNDSIVEDTTLVPMSKKYLDTIRFVKTVSVPGEKKVVATAYIEDNPTRADTARMTIVNKAIIPQVVGNRKPELLVDGSKVITAGQTCSFSVAVNDSDAQQIHIVNVWNKGKSTVVDKKTYTWTPAAGFIGKDTLTFIVTDNGVPVLSDTVVFVVDVNAHNPASVQPSISIDTTGAHVGKGDTVSTGSATINVAGNSEESKFRARIDTGAWSQWQLSGMFTYDSLTVGSHTVTIESKYEGGDTVVAEAIAFFVRSPKSTAKALSSFDFTSLNAKGAITVSARTVAVTVPYETDVSALVATFAAAGVSVKVGSAVQVSGATPNDFTKPVIYRVTAADSSYEDYTVTVEVGSNTSKAITAFSFASPNATGTINEAAKTIAVSIPYGTNRSGMSATFTTTGASVKIGSTTQVSGTTQNDFTGSVTYTVTAADETTQMYVVTVTESANSAKAITAFSFASPNATGTINETAKTIAVTVPYGTNRSGMIATFTTTGASVKIGSTTQVSGTNQNEFTGSVTYTVTAEDNSTQGYIVAVSYAPYIFTVTFDGQNATVGPTPSTKAVTSPATTVGTLPTDPQSDNFRFDGWYTGTNGGGTAFVGSTNVTQSMEVYAKWTPVYTVTYNGNGSTVTVPVDANKYPNGQTVSVLSGITRANYTFAGWNTQADSLGANYLSGNTFAMGSVNVVLYAKWRMNQPTITTQPVSQTTPVNDSVTFTVSASGANLEYQWQKNNVDITNAKTANYTTPALSIADTVASTYKCVVRNAGGSVPSSGATLAVSTVSDASGNVYHQVKIGNQVWTMENLMTTKYTDNTDIPKDTSAATWGTGTTGKFCYYGNTTNPDSIKKFGALYNWYTISPTNVKKIAPAGWHVPSDAEWDTLQNWLIANKYNWDEITSGNKIGKSMAAKTDWSTSSTIGAIGNSLETNNKSGFSALPSGSRYGSGVFVNQRYGGFWWCATEGNETWAWYRLVNYVGDYLFRDISSKANGFSLRLVSD
jgi:uncharacterized protein (TIGR02145 family)/uncharacterized repeat protein (TIGR02543 family)